jgi:N-acetylmuramoyl-L-alanine amidase
MPIVRTHPPATFRPGWCLVAGVLVLLWWWLNPPREAACAGVAPPTFALPRVTPNSLRDARVMLNPGHGLTQGDDERWNFQRPQPDGRGVFVLEDDSNLRMARAIRNALEAEGAIVDSTRELSLEGTGASGQPRWREAAHHHLERIGTPRGVWDSAGNALRGGCRAAKDLRARAYAANAIGADVMLSLHSNAAGPNARGTTVIYGNRPYLRATPADTVPKSACLAKNLARTVPQSIRTNRPWGAAAIVGADQYGENGFALMPSVILEVAYHTNAADGAALNDASFRKAVARGVVTALKAFFQQPSC